MQTFIGIYVLAFSLFWTSKKPQWSWFLPFARSVQVLQRSFAAEHSHIFLFEENPGIWYCYWIYIPYRVQAQKRWKVQFVNVPQYQTGCLWRMQQALKVLYQTSSNWHDFQVCSLQKQHEDFALWTRSCIRVALFKWNRSEGNCITRENQKPESEL